MRADERFLRQPRHFWANVRSISEHAGYTERGTGGSVKVHSQDAMKVAMRGLGLGTTHLEDADGPTELGKNLELYFRYRADVLNRVVEPRLMDAEKARTLFENTRRSYNPTCPLPRNKQTGDKAGFNYLTGMVNMLVEKSVGALPVEYDPRRLTTVTHNNAPLRTLSRRVDGAFPSPINPIAIWEIKEYYYTTTFGSRIADGVFETQLDGIELEELREAERIPIDHVLIVDAYYTWWVCGRSYLCRIIDLLHMGLVQEVVFGSEVVEAIPRLVLEWVAEYERRGGLSTR